MNKKNLKKTAIILGTILAANTAAYFSTLISKAQSISGSSPSFGLISSGPSFNYVLDPYTPVGCPSASFYVLVLPDKPLFFTSASSSNISDPGYLKPKQNQPLQESNSAQRAIGGVGLNIFVCPYFTASTRHVRVAGMNFSDAYGRTININNLKVASLPTLNCYTPNTCLPNGFTLNDPTCNYDPLTTSGTTCLNTSFSPQSSTPISFTTENTRSSILYSFPQNTQGHYKTSSDIIFEFNVPANTPPGDYSSTIYFNINTI